MIYYEILKHTIIYISSSTIFRGLQRRVQGFDCMGEKHLIELSVLLVIACFLWGGTELTSKFMSVLPRCFLHHPHINILRTWQSHGKAEQSKKELYKLQCLWCMQSCSMVKHSMTCTAVCNSLLLFSRLVQKTQAYLWLKSNKEQKITAEKKHNTLAIWKPCNPKSLVRNNLKETRPFLIKLDSAKIKASKLNTRCRIFTLPRAS